MWQSLSAENIADQLGWSVAVFCSLFFLRAGLHKAADRVRFSGIVSAYALLPAAAVPAFALLLPLIEVAAALAILVQPLQLLGAAAIMALLLLYAFAMSFNIVRGRSEIDCGCGGSASPISWARTAGNIALAVLTAAAFSDGALTTSVMPIVGGAAVGVLLFLCVGAWEQLQANSRRMAAHLTTVVPND